MTLADEKYKEFEVNIAPFYKQYSQFWCDLLTSYGFVQTNMASYWYIPFTCNNEDYHIRVNPCGFRGIWFNGHGYRKKIMTENGLRRFLKSMKLGIFAK